MKRENQRKLWPIIESCKDIGPLGLAALNVGAALALSIPFFMVLGGLCVGLWLANLAQFALLEILGISAHAASIAAYAVKIPFLFFAALLLKNLVSHIPQLVEGARQVIVDDDI